MEWTIERKSVSSWKDLKFLSMRILKSLTLKYISHIIPHEF